MNSPAASVRSVIHVVPCAKILLRGDDMHVVGPRILNNKRFFEIVLAHVQACLREAPEQIEENGWMIRAPEEAHRYVSSGVGVSRGLTSDEVIYGEKRYLKRSRSLAVNQIALQVVTVDAYRRLTEKTHHVSDYVLSEDELVGVTHVLTQIACSTLVPMQVTWLGRLARVGVLTKIPLMDTSD